MKLPPPISIDATHSRVWAIITDSENCASRISGIKDLEVIEEPTGDSIIGLKWKENRAFVGRDSPEIIGVTKVDNGAKYVPRFESHGAVYESYLAVEPVTRGAKILWALPACMMSKPMRKALQADLADLKAASEK
jgi:hypothetical protein